MPIGTGLAMSGRRSLFTRSWIVARKPELKLWGAVISCLDDCQRSDAPLATLGEFLEKLAASRWDRRDVRVVEACVLELLNWQQEQQLNEQAACPSRTQADLCWNMASAE
jgi:hypothetical protein